VTIKWTRDRHPHEDLFEEYALDRLSEEETPDFEEHLLICEQCQSTLAKTDEYIQVLKAATRAYVARPSKTSSPLIRFGDRGLRWNAAAAAVLLLTCLTALLSWRTPVADPKTIVLEAYRGGGASTRTRVPAGRPLDLRIDLKDVRPAAGYRLEVVDATGHRVWFGGTPAHLNKGLAPGTYWVRLATDTGEPLREFGLTADNRP
jgi:hypothetical protein